ncbi:hypothetical protein ACWGCW_00975 [Streptomyces sp. NPDC054933]
MTPQFEHEPGDGHVCERAEEHCTRCGARLVPSFDPMDRAPSPFIAAGGGTDGA